jgi:hypothetical protein
MKLKPFRLLGASTLIGLKTRIIQRLQHWQDDYACSPLQCQLERARAPLSHTQTLWLLATEKQPIAIMPHHDLSRFKECLFGTQENCFEQISRTLFFQCIAQLLETEPLKCQPVPKTLSLNSWFYHGAPLIMLTLEQIPLYLHPQWTCNALPKLAPSPLVLMPLSKAYDKQTLALQVVLTPLSLPLKDLTVLKVGDVIKTDHALDTPMKLKLQHHALCTVKLGEALKQKTIQLTRHL